MSGTSLSATACDMAAAALYSGDTHMHFFHGVLTVADPMLPGSYWGAAKYVTAIFDFSCDRMLRALRIVNQRAATVIEHLFIG